MSCSEREKEEKEEKYLERGMDRLIDISDKEVKRYRKKKDRSQRVTERARELRKEREKKEKIQRHTVSTEIYKEKKGVKRCIYQAKMK